MLVELVKLVMIVFVLAVPVAVYGVVVRNDLARRWEGLKALAANVRAVRQRRQGVGHDIRGHVGRAERHEERVAQFGSRRGRGGGRAVKISDNLNGWPTATTLGATTAGMAMDLQSHDSETSARNLLHDAAERYNEIVQTWPSSVVARRCGFRPWRFNSGGRRSKHR